MAKVILYFTEKFSAFGFNLEAENAYELQSYPSYLSDNLSDFYLRKKNITMSSFRRNFKSHMSRCGCAVLEDLVSTNLVNSAKREVIRFFTNSLLPCYDSQDDEFSDFDCLVHNISRMPRIANGKHNIHFDPEFSLIHKCLEKLIKDSEILDLLSYYMGKSCSLRETGISVTRPAIDGIGSYGEGMEWHSDGAEGEATMLMSVTDIDSDLGSLRVVPGSHKKYIPGVGHEKSSITQNLELLAKRAVSYPYREGQPMIIDARTLHSVANNISSSWRIICWFIVDCY